MFSHRQVPASFFNIKLATVNTTLAVCDSIISLVTNLCHRKNSLEPSSTSYCLPLVQMYILLTVFSAYSDGCDCRSKCDPNYSCDLVLSISHSLYV